jgi:stalled ribosome rescue protein Dom34
VSARYYAVVRINHNAAEVFLVNAIEESKRVVNSHTSMQRLHHRGPADGRPRHPIDRDYFSRIASTLNHVGGTLLTGPGEARFELARYLSDTRPDLAAQLDEIDALDHPGDAALVAIARDHFHLSG